VQKGREIITLCHRYIYTWRFLYFSPFWNTPRDNWNAVWAYEKDFRKISRSHTLTHKGAHSEKWEHTRKYPDWNSVCAMAKVANACLKRLLARLDRSKWNRSTIQARASTPRMTKHGKASARQRSGLSCCGHRSWSRHASYNFVVSVECERKIMTFTIRGLNSRRSVLIVPRPGYTALHVPRQCTVMEDAEQPHL
jgi:hypothetical protein